MFKINLIEGIKNIDKNRTVTYMSVILFTLLFLLQSYTYSYYVINNIQNESMEHETVKNYLIYGISSRYPYRMIINSIEPELAENLELEISEFYEFIDNSPYVKYSTLEFNGIRIENFKGDPKIFEVDTEADRLYVHCLYTSPNFHKVESYRVIKGRDFTDEDMVFVKEKPRAVLLGYKYLDVYEVGDILERPYDGTTDAEIVSSLEVIGFLAEDTTVVDERGTNVYDLDNYIVYPGYVLPIDEWGKYHKATSHWVWNISDYFIFGKTKFLIDSEYEAEGVADMQEALNDFSGFAKYYDVVNWNQALEKIHTRTETFTNFAMAITGVLMTFAVVTVIFSVINRIENNLKDYAIHISMGASSNNVIGFVISEMVIILTCSVALGLIFSKWLMAELYMPYYFLEFLGIFAITSLLVVVLSAITAKLALKKYDLCTLIK